MSPLGGSFLLGGGGILMRGPVRPLKTAHGHARKRGSEEGGSDKKNPEDGRGSSWSFQYGSSPMIHRDRNV